MSDYQLVTPSLEGVFGHDSIVYEGLRRPSDILKILDGPASRGCSREVSAGDQRILGQYFQDLHGVFSKNLASFASSTQFSPLETTKLLAMLQEMIKVKKLIYYCHDIP